jgi:regulator of protease activity HflC (stomatin/prohibitin superfamily)
MFSFVMGIIFFLIALALFILKFPSSRGKVRVHPLISGVVFGFAILFVTLSLLTTVGPKNVGIVTEYGAATGTRDSGISIKEPWAKVTEINSAVVTNKYYGDNVLDGRIGDGSWGAMNVTIRWRINPDKANVIYADYRNDNKDDPTEAFRKAVVSPELQTAVQKVLGAYNPIADLKVVPGGEQDATAVNFVPDVDQMSADLTTLMKDRLRGDNLATVVKINVTGISLSKNTQKYLDQFTGEVGKTRVAAQKEATAFKEAAANKALGDSVTNNPGVLQSKCLDLLSDAIEKDYGLPAGFNCLGAGSAVVLPSSK